MEWTSIDDSDFDDSSVFTSCDDDYEVESDDEFDPYPLLYFHIEDRDWTEALKRIASHPHEVDFQGGIYDYTVLHLALDKHSCSMPPSIEVVKAILATNPTLIYQEDIHRRTPLCLALAGMEENPADGFIYNEAIRAILAVDPRIVRRRSRTDKKSELSRFISNTWTPEVGKRDIEDPELQRTTCCNDLAGKNQVLWERADLLLHAFAYERVREDRSFSCFLHSVILVKSSSMVKLARNLCPQQAYERDPSGRVPLVIAATCRFESRVKYLTENFPGSARYVDYDGRLPLHLGLEAGLEYLYGARLILEDAPEALATRDVITNLYPFMTAATTCSVDTIFELLRQNPLLASGLADDPPWRRKQLLQERIKNLELENQKLKEKQDAENRKLKDEYEERVRRLEEDNKKLREALENACVLSPQKDSCGTRANDKCSEATTHAQSPSNKRKLNHVGGILQRLS